MCSKCILFHFRINYPHKSNRSFSFTSKGLSQTSHLKWFEKLSETCSESKREQTEQECVRPTPRIFSKQPLHGYIAFIGNRALVPDRLLRTLCKAASVNDGPQWSANELGWPETFETYLWFCFKAAKRSLIVALEQSLSFGFFFFSG